ncbi:MAG: helix-hairpin-helix domain-containing protein, partial [Anaerolineales bacterium]
MPIHNTDVADILNKIADLLEIADENPFRIRAYRNAALTVSGLSREVTDLVAAAEDLSKLPGIGKDLAGKIEEIVRTGSLKQLSELQKETPGELTDLMKVAQLGPKRVAALYKQLGIKDTAGL